jgi:hypothetical protein
MSSATSCLNGWSVANSWSGGTSSSLLLVELDPGSPPLEARNLRGDPLLERRVLVAVFVDEDEARVPGSGLQRLDFRDSNLTCRH